MPRIVTQEELDALLAQHPLLSAYGFPLVASKQAPAERELPALADVRASVRYLETLQPWKVGERRAGAWPSSYYLKHRMEEAPGGRYVTNGAMVAAAMLLGLGIRQRSDDPGNPNPMIGVHGVSRSRVVDRAADIDSVWFGPHESSPAPVDTPCAVCDEPMAEESRGEMVVHGGTVITAWHEGCRHLLGRGR